MLRQLVAKSQATLLEAAANGATLGGKLAINVAAMLIAFVGLVAMVNWGVGLVYEGLTSRRFSAGFSPHLLGCSIGSGLVGQLLGEKLVLTELPMFIWVILSGPEAALQRSAVIATYALCVLPICQYRDSTRWYRRYRAASHGRFGGTGWSRNVCWNACGFYDATVAGIMLEDSLSWTNHGHS